MPQVMMNSFVSGEFSPKLHARTDLEKYRSACKELRNCFIQPQGGVYGRPGTRYVAAAKHADKVARLIPFEFSTTQAYILEMGDQYFRFFMDEGQIISGTPVELASPYLEAHLFDVKYSQSADVMFLAHQSYAPRKLTRTSHTSWSIQSISFVDGPYMRMNTDTTKTLTPSVNALGATGTLTATGHTPFNINHVGSYWRLSHNSGVDWGYVLITGFTSSSLVNITVQKALGATTATAFWREGSFSAYRGYPSCVGFSEERLWWASTPSEQQTVWGSVNGSFEDMTPGTADDDAVTYVVASSYVNPFHSMTEDRGITLGTSKAQFRLQGGSDAPLTPSNARAMVQTNYGSKGVQPIKVGDSTVYLTRSGKKVRSLEYNFNKDSYSSPDLTILSEHITGDGIVDWCYQQEPDSILAGVRSDGKFASMTYVAEQNVLGWAQHDTQGEFESFACIPHGDGDQIWALVNRTVDGSTVRYIEFFDPDLNMDCAISYDGVAVSTVTGLDHLEGKEVVIVGDGAVYNSQTVDGGEVELTPDGPAEVIDVGLSFTPRIVTLRPEVPTQDGSIQGKKKRWVDVGVRLLNTKGVTINGDQVESRSSDDEMDESLEAVTGDEYALNTGWDREGEITIEQTLPLPFNVLGVFGHLEVED
jgi:hypothetical protein